MTSSPYGRRGHRRGRGPWHDAGGRPDRRAARDQFRSARYDRRYHRRMVRRSGRAGPPMPLGVIVLGTLLLIGSAALAKTIVVIAVVVALVLVGVAVIGVWSAVRAAVVGDTAHRDAVETPPDPVVTAEQAWCDAREDFRRVRAAFAAHETDPMEVLRRPALSDVSVPSTARFVDAFAAAQALDTDDYPGEPYSGSYCRAVEQARRSWEAAVEAADRIRLSGLGPEERRTVERVVKLLTTARDSDSEPERLAAYARARSELDRLERAGVVHLPKPARARLDANARRELPGT